MGMRAVFDSFVGFFVCEQPHTQVTASSNVSSFFIFLPPFIVISSFLPPIQTQKNAKSFLLFYGYRILWISEIDWENMSKRFMLSSQKIYKKILLALFTSEC
jgi:hypothetical protein